MPLTVIAAHVSGDRADPADVVDEHPVADEERLRVGDPDSFRGALGEDRAAALGAEGRDDGEVLPPVAGAALSLVRHGGPQPLSLVRTLVHVLFLSREPKSVLHEPIVQPDGDVGRLLLILPVGDVEALPLTCAAGCVHEGGRDALDGAGLLVPRSPSWPDHHLPALVEHDGRRPAGLELQAQVVVGVLIDAREVLEVVCPAVRRVTLRCGEREGAREEEGMHHPQILRGDPDP